MNESDARTALRAMGILAPSRSLIENWLRAALAEQILAEADKEAATASHALVASEIPPDVQQAVERARDRDPARCGKSLLEPVLRGQSTLQEPSKGRKPGRPRIVAGWFPSVAATMADGTALRTALAIHGLVLSKKEMRALYRNKAFQGLYQEARRRYLIENWGRKGPSLRSVLGRAL